MAQRAPAHPRSMTVEEFLDYDFPAWVSKAELVRGELRMTPTPKARHAAVADDLLFLLTAYVRERGHGRVFGDRMGYELVQLPRTVRVPDVSFVRADRLPPDWPEASVFPFAPDLAVEVLSPSERGRRLDEKLFDYAAAGTPLVWLIEPRRRTVTVHSAAAPVRLLREGHTIDGGPVLPGFACPVAEIFARIPR